MFFALNFPQHNVVYAQGENTEMLIFKTENMVVDKTEEFTITPTKMTNDSEIQIEEKTQIENTIKTMYVYATAYNSLENQTDSSPCVTANGYNLCESDIEDTIAANFLPFGTKIRIPDYFGDRVFVVRDRMNVRYENRIDVWMKEYIDARKFGKRYLKIEILENTENALLATNIK